MSNTKIINGQVYLVSNVGNISILFNPKTTELLYSFSIGQTEGWFPFGLSLIMNPRNNNIGLFGLGTRFSSYQTFNTVNNKINVTNYFGEVKSYELLDEPETFIEDEVEVEYNYFCYENGVYLRTASGLYYFRDARGNITTIRASDSFIMSYKGIDGSGYNYDEQNEKYVGINNNSSIKFQYVNNATYVDIISVFEGNTSTTLMSKVELTYTNNRISKVVYYKLGNIVESYDLLNTSEGNYMVYKIIDNTRNMVTGFYYEQGNNPKVLIKSYRIDNEDYGPVTTVDYYGHDSYVEIKSQDGYIMQYWYDINNILLYQIDKYGFVKSYQFDHKKRLISESNVIQILTSKNEGESLNTNSNFASLLDCYNYIGVEPTIYEGEISSSLVTVNGEWIKLQSAGYNDSTLEYYLDKSGYKGDEHTFSTYFYVIDRGAENNNIQVSLEYYGVNNQLINLEYQSISANTGDLIAINVSCMANGNYNYIKAKISLRAVSTIAVKYFHIYEIPVGSKIKYGNGGKVIYKKQGKEFVEFTYDLGLYLTSLISDKTPHNTLEYDEKGRVTSSTDIYGNETTYTYNEYNEIVSQSSEVDNKKITSSKSITRTISSNTMQVITTDSLGATSVTKTTYDGKLLKSYYDNETPLIGYTYTTKNDLERISESENPIRNQNITYDGSRRYNSVASANGSVYTYSYSYDSLGQLIELFLDSTTVSLVKQEYDNYGRIIKKYYGNKDYYQFTYNQEGLIYYIQYNGATQPDVVYNYDGKQRISAIYSPYFIETYKQYTYNSNDVIKGVVINEFAHYSYIYNNKDNLYIVTYSDQRCKTIELQREFDYRKFYSPKSVTDYISDKFYSCYLMNQNMSLIRYDADGNLKFIQGYGAYSSQLIKNRILNYFDNTSIAGNLSYIFEVENMSQYTYGFIYKTDEDINGTSAKIISDFCIENDEYRTVIRLYREGSKLIINYMRHGMQTSDNDENFDLMIIENAITSSWNHIVLNMKCSNPFIINVLINGVEHSIDYESSSRFFNERGNVIMSFGQGYNSPLHGETGYFSGVIYSDNSVCNMDINYLKSYYESIKHNIIDLLNNELTLSEDVINESDIYYGTTSGVNHIPFEKDFVTSSNIKPISKQYLDGSGYAEYKDNPFVIDENLKRYVFDSDERICVTYDSNTTSSSSYFSIKFKCLVKDTIDELLNNIISIFGNSNISLHVNKSSETSFTLCHSYNSYSYDVIEGLSYNTWYEISLSITPTKITIKVDGNTYNFDAQISMGESSFRLGYYKGVRYSSLFYGAVSLTALNSYSLTRNRVTSDVLGRVKSNITYKSDTSVATSSAYTYQNSSSSNGITSFNISKEVIKRGTSVYRVYNYQYDAIGRITQYGYATSASSTSLSNVHTYTYNKCGYLETDVTDSSNVQYLYDNNGNIKRITSSASNSFNVIKNYTYNTTYKDRLEKITINNGEEYGFTYNSLNPYELTKVTYPNANTTLYTFTWRGRRLSSLTYNNETTINYYYDEEGLRTRKVITNSEGTNTIRYVYNNGQLISQIDSNNKYIRFIYGQNGRPISFIYNGARYFYIWNQLEIIGICNQNGVVVVSYEYDSYGNILSISGNLSSSIGQINPFVYRGYYYDHETNLFLVTSRYYSPELGRFIQPADVSSLNPSSINGLNLFSYANNNPIGSVAYGTTNSNGMQGHSISKKKDYNIFASIGALLTSFEIFDNWSGYLSSGLEEGFNFLGSNGVGIKPLGSISKIFKFFGTGMIALGSVLSWGNSVYNNFNNPNYTTGEAIVASVMDAGYYAVKGFLQYKAGEAIGAFALYAGISLGGALLLSTGSMLLAAGLGLIVSTGIVVFGAFAVNYLGEKIDDLWEWIKEQIFE